jgi:hypothetical protein
MFGGGARDRLGINLEDDEQNNSAFQDFTGGWDCCLVGALWLALGVQCRNAKGFAPFQHKRSQTGVESSCSSWTSSRIRGGPICVLRLLD